MPDTKHVDQQEFHVRSECDDRNSIKEMLITSYRKNLEPALKADIYQKTHDPACSTATCDNQWTTSWWVQFKVLLSRGLRERKHESYSGLRIFQVMSVSILSGLMWWHSNTSHIQDQVLTMTPPSILVQLIWQPCVSIL